MATFQSFDRDILVATAGLSDAAISAHLATFAKQALAEAIQSGQGSRQYVRYVGGIEGAVEESVKAPGPIVYEFIWWGDVIRAALAQLVKRSPRRSGRYAASFQVIVGGRTVVTDFDNIPGRSEVIILNAQPYTRKIEVGAMSMSVPPYHFDSTTAAMRRLYGGQGAFRFETRFVNVPGGIHPLMPYRLKGTSGRGKAKQAGAPLTYPAIVMNMVH